MKVACCLAMCVAIALAGCASIAESVMSSEGMAATRRGEAMLQLAAFAHSYGMVCTLPLNSPPELVTICERRGETYLSLTREGARLKFLVFVHPQVVMVSETVARTYVAELAIPLRKRLEAAFGSAVS